MKYITLSLALFASCTLFAAENPYQGSWLFVKGSYQTADGQVFHSDNQAVTAIKDVANDKFTLVNIKQGSYNGYLSGRFVVTGAHYEEHIEQGTSEEHLNKVFTFEGSLKHENHNGKKVLAWYHKGIVNGVTEQEVWHKIEK